ncbi:MAG: class I SAM-dependent methyltransferase, partial [Thermoleophilia bacterium]|nr:class I SAM-dependent methyltransferase [Thermoleophilia bacterium]
MTRPAPAHDAVKEHYRGLAPDYSGRANATCEAVYGDLAHRFLGGLGSVLEIGGGSAGLLETLGAAEAVACDLSEAMLRARGGGANTRRVVAAGERLPFPAGRFDGALCVNVLEHVADVDAVLAEAARVLRPGGVLLAITPNGRWERLLDLAERLHLKIPEGPHAFLHPDRLAAAAAP